jgi:hypothetical protein
MKLILKRTDSNLVLEAHDLPVEFIDLTLQQDIGEKVTLKIFDERYIDAFEEAKQPTTPDEHL